VGAAQPQACKKIYLSADSSAIEPRWIPATAASALDTEYQIEGIVPFKAKHMIVTWDIKLESVTPEDATRYTITIDRTTGPVCGATPLVKFQVPLEKHPIDDCHFVQQSKLRGATQPFRINLCAGEEIAAAFTESVAVVCPAVACGVAAEITPQKDPAPLARVIVKVYLY
jgi:hypothetical protein